MVRAVVPPTVPLGTERVRICLHAGNTIAEIEALVSALQEWCEIQPKETETKKRDSVQIRARL